MDGAITRWGSTLAVDPARNMSAWSMCDGARHHGVHQGQDLAARLEPTGAATQPDRRVAQSLEAESAHQGGDEQQTGIGHQIRIVKGHSDPVDSARY